MLGLEREGLLAPAPCSEARILLCGTKILVNEIKAGASLPENAQTILLSFEHVMSGSVIAS